MATYQMALDLGLGRENKGAMVEQYLITEPVYVLNQVIIPTVRIILSFLPPFLTLATL